MKLTALPAAKGDCLILEHVDKDGTERLILIDGGPSGVFAKTLKPKLLKLREERIAAGRLAEDAPLMIDLVVISHIDDDHINGIKALLQDMVQRADDEQPAVFVIGRLWHNGFDSLLGAQTGQVASPSAVVTASLGGSDPDAEADDARRDVLKVLASIAQGQDVVRLAKTLGIAINPEFGGATIKAGDGTVLDVHGLQVTVIGPLDAELDALRADFAKWLAKGDRAGASPASLLASFTDTSIANLSSIVLLVEDKGVRYLLTGDARGDTILQGLEKLGLLKGDATFALDILKVQHHGSDRNSTAGFFRALPAKHYIFSGNGEHGNPERETFNYLSEARQGAKVVVELTYTPAQIDTGRAADRKKHGKTFDRDQDGIEPYFTATPSFTLLYPE